MANIVKTPIENNRNELSDEKKYLENMISQNEIFYFCHDEIN
jgi:hypothetical protein